MQLHDYFQHQHQYHLSDQEKADIFHRINQKRLEQSTARRHFSYKKISYTFIVSVIVLLTFGGFRMEKYGGIDNLFFSSNPTNPTDVYADYIAEIIEFNGEYTLTNGEKSLTSPYIHNGDTINLKAGAEMLFTLTDKSQAKIIGPASLSITKDSNHNYTIYLIAGNFFKIFNET
jgi:hypothetical protein